jgi:NifB/MoaA-like Fe-S oxidoreductase
LLAGLTGKDLGEGILLPSLMLKHDDTRFLDDMTVEELSDRLQIPIYPVGSVEESIECCVK